MVKTLTANMQAHLLQRTLTLSNMWKMTRQDGTILGFTDHDEDLTYDDGFGALLYEARSGMSASALSSSNEMRVDTQEADGLLTSTRITSNDIRAGRYDNAEIRHFKVNWQDLSASMGDIKMKITHTGEVGTKNQVWVTELRALAQAYSQNIIDLIQPQCGVDLGSLKCKVRLDPPFWAPFVNYTVREARDAGTGSVVKPTVHNDRHFKCITAGQSAGSGNAEPDWNLTVGGTTPDQDVVWETIRALKIPSVGVIEAVNKGLFWVDYTGDAPNDLFTLGVVEFLAGPNIGLFREIKDFDSGTDGPSLIKTYLPFPFEIQSAVTSTGPDIVSFVAGCEKSRDRCKDPFDNIENYHGFPDLPGRDQFIRGGTS